jgi:predicted  nucleic acid-binding Zn-ribbon protein
MEKMKDNGLRRLHELHLQLQDVQEQLDRGPRRLKARAQATRQKQADLDAQMQKHKTLRLTADQKALQLKTNEAKIVDLRSKLNMANSNREFDIIKGQIEADTMANSVLEDEILATLEKVDGAQVAVRELEQELATAKSDEQRIAAEIEAAEPGLAQQVAELQTQITDAERCLPAETAVVYRRLVQAHGAAALAEVEGDICSACYVTIPPQLLVFLRTGQILFCKTCGRLLYTRNRE